MRFDMPYNPTNHGDSSHKNKDMITGMHTSDRNHCICIVNRIPILKSFKINIFQTRQISCVKIGLLYTKQKKEKGKYLQKKFFYFFKTDSNISCFFVFVCFFKSKLLALFS